MKTPVSPKTFLNQSLSIQPIPMNGLYERYLIDMRSGLIYDLEECVEITPDTIDDQLIVTLVDNDGQYREYLLGDLLIRIIYGYTNSKFRPANITFPCDTSILVPRIHQLMEIDDRRIEINGITYYRWLDSEYYVSSYGVIYSIPYGRFLRHSYTEKGYCTLHTKENKVNKSYRVHRLVWESQNGPIPPDKEIDHINDIRWDNRISNLQLLTHLENLQKINPEKFKSYPAETIIAIGKDLQNGVPTKVISEKYGILREKVWEIKFRNFYSEILKNAGVDLSNVERDDASRFNKAEIIEDIYQMYNNNISAIDIADKYKVTPGYIHQILRRNADMKSA